ncbi:hypothetical protein [Pseudolactococcus raffinolactis]|uniref:hypothetical protein n=1 Tax=Pseudolactococcus raffinolactis TaxID=1366 RepID=UPI001C7003BE|nr:hypothetical protein [Lactococcus raffinolactis]
MDFLSFWYNWFKKLSEVKMYYLVKASIPYLQTLSTATSIVLFIFWIFQMKSKYYIKRIERKAKYEMFIKQRELDEYNSENPSHMLQMSSGWLEAYYYRLSKRYNTVFLSLVFAYISFNISSYYESSNDNFYKLLGISTTLFLAGAAHIQGKINK